MEICVRNTHEGWVWIQAVEEDPDCHHNTKVIGSCEIQELDDHLNLWNLGVKPAWRNQGIGKALLIAARDYATKRHLPIQGFVRDTNLAALQFYQNLGIQLKLVDGSENAETIIKTPFYFAEWRPE